MAVQWQEAMSIGVADLDAEHRAMLELLNSLEAGLEGGDDDGVADAMRDLVGLMSEHFSREEDLLSGIGCPSFYAHRDGHDAIADRIHLLRRRYLVAVDSGARRDVASALLNFTRISLLDHILTEDHAMGRRMSPAAIQPSLDRSSESEAGATVVPVATQDVEYSLPPHLAHLLNRLHYTQAELPPPHGGYATFEVLCAEAVARRIDEVLVVFHKRNACVSRKLPPPFFLSPEFADRFRRVVERLIMPELLKSRRLRQMTSRCDWKVVDSESFWEYVDNPLAEDLLERWRLAWDEMRLVERVRDDGSRVFQVKETTRILREMLQPPTPEAYDLPRIGNVEIETLKSLFDPTRDLAGALHAGWQRCQDLYEQEMEPRVFQQKAREGALRDYLLLAHQQYAANWGEFLTLSVHRVFGRVTSHFLERFSTSLGRSEQERAGHMPYLMRYLHQLRDHPEIRRQEREEEAQWQAQRQELQNFLKGVTAAA
nr:hemerythrin family protein [Paramagnetospirillum magneticum]